MELKNIRIVVRANHWLKECESTPDWWPAVRELTLTMENAFAFSDFAAIFRALVAFQVLQ